MSDQLECPGLRRQNPFAAVPRATSKAASMIAVSLGLALGIAASPSLAQPSPPEADQPVVYEGHPSALEPSPQQPQADKANNEPAPAQEVFPGSSTAVPLDEKVTEQAPAGIAAPTAPSPANSAKAARPFTVATWSGAYGQALKTAVVDRFRADVTGQVEVVERTRTNLAEFSAATGGLGFDALEVSAAEADAGCKSGRLVKLDSLAALSSDADGDFLEGGLKPCGIGAFAWSQVVVFNPGAFDNQQPSTLADVFDIKRYPGKRALIRNPRFLLEMALLADGAAPGEVYELLINADGRKRAFRKLATLFGHIHWAENSTAALDAMAQGKATIAQTFSGKAFFAAARGAPLEIIWDGQIYEMTYWAISNDSPRKKQAEAFIKFATEPKQLAAVAQRIPYGPVRKSAVALTKRHVTVGIKLDRFLPTAAGNMQRALAKDDAWWSQNETALKAEFDAWLSDLETAILPTRKPGREG
ncbi:MAG: extracellular solute-binding protein [Alphaproteobacteria bacterium]|nr:extracellular solute-binding protein [Alphaproteobacteria bacterium]